MLSHESSPSWFKTHLDTPWSEEIALRPRSLDQFVGQKAIIENLKTFVSSAKIRKRSLDHVLIYGPPGLGKTTLSHIIAQEMEAQFKSTTGPAIQKTGDLVAILTQLGANDILFIDEIHRLPIAVEEVLYGAMEDKKIDILLSDGPQARTLQISLPPFTLVGATTRWGALSAPLRDRFGIIFPLSFYEVSELEKVLVKALEKWEIPFQPSALGFIAKAARGTPRLALRLLRRVVDFAVVHQNGQLEDAHVNFALKKLGVDSHGLDHLDMRYLRAIYQNGACKPMGLETLCSILSESKETLEDVVEPFLLQQNWIEKTMRGRQLSLKGRNFFLNSSLF